MSGALGRLDALPRRRLAHLPTPLEALPNLSRAVGGAEIFVKRDDCTGLAFGGNKIRQVEFYLGEAVARGADTVLITGAVQSNFVRSTAAAARKLGLDCHVQLEERVADPGPTYRASGNAFLDRLLGATVHSYPDGEDEEGADARIREIAEALRTEGRRPYVVPLAPGHPPLGALGYVDAARELAAQTVATGLAFDEIFVASGSGSTHAGLLFGLRAMGIGTPVMGVCVRREASRQVARIRARCREIAELLETDPVVADADVRVVDAFLAPGYGRLNTGLLGAIELAAREEALFLDPVYTARTMAATLAAAKAGPGRRLLMVHTGGDPALFAYEPELSAHFRAKSR